MVNLVDGFTIYKIVVFLIIKHKGRKRERISTAVKWFTLLLLYTKVIVFQI